MTKGKPATPATKAPGRTVASFPVSADKEKGKAMADLALNPSASAVTVSAEYLTTTYGEQDLGSLVGSLTSATEKVQGGDMSGCEAMLYGQAQALQDIFASLARRATRQEHLKQWDAFMRMALRAQNQSRMALETLATIKNPPVVFAKQANFAAGHQQVNNGLSASHDPSRATDSQFEQSKLLGVGDGERLDTRAPGTASGANQELETVGAFNGATHSQGQGAGVAKRLQGRDPTDAA